MLAGAEGEPCVNLEIDCGWIGRVAGRVNEKAPGADRLEPGLAHRNPIILAQMLDIRLCPGGEPPEQHQLLSGRLIGEISMDPPVVGRVGIRLVGDQHRRRIAKLEQMIAVRHRLRLGAGAM